MTNLLVDNNYVIYALTITTISLISYLVIKYNSTPIESPNSTPIESPNYPQTFNFSPEQMREIKEFMEEGGVLNEETNEKLDQDFQTLLGEENYNNFQADTQLLDNQFHEELLRIFAEELSRL